METDEERTGLQKDLDRLGDWSVRNKMPFNVSKCKIMHIGKKNIKYKYKIISQELLETTEEKDLGVFLRTPINLVLIAIKLVRKLIKLLD